MTAPASARPDSSRALTTLLLGLIALGVGLLAISHQSYWIDEASTVHKAMMPTVAGWWERLRGNPVERLISLAEGIDVRVFPQRTGA